jgi:hypothetical protein
MLGLILFLSMVLSCKKQVFFAGEDALIRVNADRSSIRLNENVRITITGYNSDGSYLWDGTRVDLTIENGTLERSWVELEGGTASVTASGNVARGEMKISARSGIIIAVPNPLIIQVGQVQEVDRITASLSPAVLPYTGGRVQIVVTVYDRYFQPIAGINAVLEADAGTLDSRGAPLVTNASGQVTDWLETHQECTVTIYSGSKTKTVTVSLEEEPQPNTEPFAEFTFSPSEPISGETVYFNASGSYDPDGFIQDYTWDFGDGSVGSGERPTHKFDVGEFQSRTFTVTLKVIDNQDAHAAYSQQITVNYK